MAAITVTERIDWPVPGVEVITATPANAETYTARFKYVTGVVFGAMSASWAAGTAISAVVSSNNILTFTVTSTAVKQTIMIFGHD